MPGAYPARAHRGNRARLASCEPLRAAIGQRFAGARSRLVGARVHVEVDGVWYRARLELGPEARVVVGLPCTDGFELTLRWNDRWANDGSPRAPTFDDSFLVETNDLALAGVWLDHEARWGLLSSRYVAETRAERKTALLFRDGAWVHEVSDDEVSARRRDGEASFGRMTDMLHASLVLASRPVRWARAFEQVGRALGGAPAARLVGRQRHGRRPVPVNARRSSIEVIPRSSPGPGAAPG